MGELTAAPRTPLTRAALELGAVMIAVTLLLGLRLGLGGLGYPAEAEAVERVAAGAGTPTLDAAASWFGIAVVGATTAGARAGHLLFGIAAIGAVFAIARSRSRRAGLFAAAALLASPAVVFAARSSAGGIVVLFPLAVSAWGLVEHRSSGRRVHLAVGAVGATVAALAVGLLAAVVPLAIAVATARIGRRRVAIEAIATTAITVGLSTLLLIGLGASLAPAAGAPAPAFDAGLGRLALGCYPLVVALPFALVRDAVGDARARTRRLWLVQAVLWLIPLMLWPSDPWLALAPVPALAVVAANAFEDLAADHTPAPALAIAAALGVAVALRSFDLEPERLVGAHLDGDVLTEIALGWVGRIGLAVVAVAFAVAAIGASRRALALAIALGVAGAVNIDTSQREGSGDSVAPLVARARDFGVPIVAGLEVEGRALTYVTGRPLRTLADVDELAAVLMADGSCRAALVAGSQLAAVERRARGRYVVLGDARADLRLVASCLPAGATDANPLAHHLLARLPDPLPGRGVEGEWGGAIQIRAIDVAPSIAATARELPLTLVFAVVAPPPPKDLRLIVRLVGCGQMITGDHPLVGGALGTSQLRPGDIVVDRATVSLEEVVPCTYTIEVGWREGRAVVPASRGGVDESERIPLGTVVIGPARR